MTRATSQAGAAPAGDARARVAVLIPALDEERALPLVLAALPRAAYDLCVVADNGSRDGTARAAAQGGALVVREPRRGYGSACLAGLDVLLSRAPLPADAARFAPLVPLRAHDVVAFLDADLSDHPEELPQVLAPILAGEADLVVGSRTRDPASRAALTPQQRFGNALACALLRLLFGARHTDLGPFRAIRVDALERLAMRDRDYGWTVEMQLKARVARLAVVEVPVRYRARAAGESKVSGTLVGSLRAGWKILGWIVGWRLALWSGRARLGAPRARKEPAAQRWLA